jgi:signal transduction histidine kinase
VAVAYGAVYALLFLLADHMRGLAYFSLWFPAAGLRFALLLCLGWRFAPLAFAAEVLGQGLVGEWAKWQVGWVTMLPGIGAPVFLTACVVGLLQSLKLTSWRLTDFREVVWLLIGAVVAPLVSAPASVSLLLLDGRMTAGAFLPATVSFWVGDAVGTLMVMPLLVTLIFMLVHRRRGIGTVPIPYQSLRLFMEVILAFLAGVSLLGLASAPVDTIQWYPLLLPMIWLSFRYGFTGAAASVFILNLASAVILSLAPEAVDRFELQLFLMMMSLTGLVVGGISSAKARAEKETREKAMELAHHGRISTMGEMAAGIVHELAHPLGLIEHYAKRAIASQAPKDEYPGLIERQAAHMRHIVARLRAFSRRAELNLEWCALKDVIEEMEALIRFEARRGDVAVSFRIAPDVEEMWLDRVQIQHCILNLATNAMAAMADVPNRQLMIEALWQDAKTAVLKVRDTGRGMEDGKLDVIFSSFQSYRAEGVGLGLAIVKSIVEEHGGRIAVESRVGEGTTFTIALPINRRVR